MPEQPTHRTNVHPGKRAVLHGAIRRKRDRRSHAGSIYAELRCKSNFSFLRGASHPEELVQRAAELGYVALAVTDRNTLAGAVRMHCAAKAVGQTAEAANTGQAENLKLIIGAEITPVDAPPVTLYAMDRTGYAGLCRIITQGRLRAIKGSCAVRLDDIAEWSEGLIAAVAETNDHFDPARSPDRKGFDVDDAAASARRERPWPLPDGWGSATRSRVGDYRDIFGGDLYLAVGVHGGPDDPGHLVRTAQLARHLAVPMVATNDVHYHDRNRRFLQDVLTCIRERCTLEGAGRRLFANAERHLKPVDEMQRLFAAYPDAIARTVEIADRCRFNLDELRYAYPEALCPPGREPPEFLAELTWNGGKDRYPGGIPAKVRKLIEHELALIAELGYEPYFLTVWDIVRFARSRDILCQGRGSAANSAVCYCLGVTSVDPDQIEILFERFVSAERNEPPDIDVDFEHERREEVFEYIYNKYGRDHAAIVAEVITYRPRSAIRDVGKALGLSLDHVDSLAKKHDWWEKEAARDDSLRSAGLDPADRTVRMLTRLVDQILGFPRHLSQHVGGFVITRGPLCDIVPIENGAMPGRTFIEWDKDDIDALGILKIDCLALGMLTAIRKCFDLLNEPLRAREPGHDRKEAAGESHTARIPLRSRLQGYLPRGRGSVRGGSASMDHPLALHTVPREDPAVYEMASRADTVGVFQIESRAQMATLPRLKPRCYYDLVVEIALIRPGPIQGGMVHPYLRRRAGKERITYPNDAIQAVLERTLGVPLFQEQAMKLAIVAAGFTPGEADQLRRAMAAWRRSSDISRFRTKLIEGMKANGLSPEFAERCYQQICGFGEYGFPESHAASFAHLVYISAWLKRYHPSAFCAAILNSQPMGFYQPAQLVRDAREHGVKVLRIDVNHSAYDCTLDPGNVPNRARPEAAETSDHDPSSWGAGGPALRLGMRLIKGISPAKVEGIENARCDGPFRSVADIARRSRVPAPTLARLAAADAMQSLGLSRREALWHVLALGEDPPFFDDLDLQEPSAALPDQSPMDGVIQDYDAVGLSLRAHPMELVRESLARGKVQPNRTLRSARHGRNVRVAGLVICRQRPATARGVTFITLEDETGIANLVVRQAVYDDHRHIIRCAVALLASGIVERQGDVVHVSVRKLKPLSDVLRSLASVSRDFH